MTQAELLATLEEDPNWRSDFTTQNFRVFSRHSLLKSGKANEPIPGMRGRLADLPTAAGFHGISDNIQMRIERLVESIDKKYFANREHLHRISEKPIPIVLWDASYPSPIPEASHSVKRSVTSNTPANDSVTFNTPANDPETISNENPNEADFLIFIPLPNIYYWGEIRPEWLCGAIAHEMCHVWTAWFGPPDLLYSGVKNSWLVVDEMLAVWAESYWTPSECRTANEYAAEWALQSGVSLYGVEPETKDYRCNFLFGYHLWPFFCWLHTIYPLIIEQFLLKSSKGTFADPWKCLDATLRESEQNVTLSKIHSEYASVVYTSQFLKDRFTERDAQWYLKSVEEVFCFDDKSKEISIQSKLLPLSHRAYLFRNLGEKNRQFQVILSPSGEQKGYGLHLVKEDGNGHREAVLHSTDSDPPYELTFTEDLVIIVVSCSRLTESKLKLNGVHAVTAFDFSLKIVPV